MFLIIPLTSWHHTQFGAIGYCARAPPRKPALTFASHRGVPDSTLIWLDIESHVFLLSLQSNGTLP
jgi:hypothetical protein